MNESNPAPRRRAYGGLVRRRETWSLTWRGWLAGFTLLLLGGLALLHGSYGFLAVQDPVQTGTLVVEGWIPRFYMTSYVAGVKFDRIYTTGDNTLTDPFSKDPSDTFASVARRRILRLGVPEDKVTMVPCFITRRDRTYAMAVALREWCHSNNVQLTEFNLISMGPHARRSRMLYQEAFGKEVKVGVVALVNKDYDPKEWWRYSEGIKEMISEASGYLYARFLFKPDRH